MNTQIKHYLIFTVLIFVFVTVQNFLNFDSGHLKYSLLEKARYYDEITLYEDIKDKSAFECSPYLDAFGEYKYDDCIRNYTFYYVVYKGNKELKIQNSMIYNHEYEMEVTNWYKTIKRNVIHYLLSWNDIKESKNRESVAIKFISDRRHKHYLEYNPL